MGSLLDSLNPGWRSGPGYHKVRSRSPGLRVCLICDQEKPLSDFPVNQNVSDGLHTWCRSCKATKQKVNSSKPEVKAKRKEVKKKDLQILRGECLSAYGNKCQCCGETQREFLVFDHINGGGSEHRERVGAGTGFYIWLKKNQFPSTIRVLCNNCNGAKGMYGYCPHNPNEITPVIRRRTQILSNLSTQEE